MYPIRAIKQLEFDIAPLLRPLDGASPTGESLRYEGTYDKIREARIEDDPVISRGVWKLPLKSANWSDVAAMCLEALEKRSKDLQLAVWLTEAWLHVYDFDGLRQGLGLLAALTREFWDGIHPKPDFESTDAVEYRVAPVEWLNEKLPATVKMIALTAPASDDVPRYCWADWETAGRAKPAGSASKNVTQAQFQQSALLTPTGFFQGMLSGVEASMDACTDLEAALAEKAGTHAPSLRLMSGTIDEIRRLIVSIVNQRDIQNPPATHAAAPGSQTRAEPESQQAIDMSVNAGPISSRAEAYRRLSEAADYLARTEPHSPTPYLVRRAISWGSMRLEDLLPDLFRNHAEVDEVFRLLQIAKTQHK